MIKHFFIFEGLYRNTEYPNYKLMNGVLAITYINRYGDIIGGLAVRKKGVEYVILND